MNKRLILIVILILAIAGSAYYYFTNNSNTENEVQSSKGLSVRKILDEQVISPVSAYNSNSIWYFNKNGRLFKVNTDGTGLSEFPIPFLPNGKLTQILWPKQGTDFISILNDDNQRIVKTFYNSKNKIYFNLPENVLWIEWLPDGKKIAYVWQSTDKKSQQLVVANPDGTGFKTVAQLFWSDLALKSSPDGKTVLMYRIPGSGAVNKIYSANLETGVISTVIDAGYNLGALWLSNNKFVYEQSGKIFIYNLVNQQSTDLNLPTSINKIVADHAAKFLYASVAGADGGDKIVKLNLDNGQSETYFQLAANVKVRSMLLVGNTVYYIDNKDGKLYAISR